MEKYTAFPMGQRLVFIDSFQFMSSSLASLAKSLAPTDFKHLTNEFGERTELMERKGVYPYEYMDSFERFEEDCLPAQSKFFSSLTGEGITDEDYDHAKEVWKAFGMIMITTWQPTCYCWQTFLRALGAIVLRTMDWIRATTSLPQAWLGTQCLA